jgi:D-3-phosphoglycerate dehydrogenase
LLRQSDFITLHVPFLDKPAIGREEFAILKDGVGLVNASRGGVIDELELVKALDSGKVSFVGLDVYDNEPTPRRELLSHPKVSLTPHIGAATNEAQERIGEELASLLIENLKK